MQFGFIYLHLKLYTQDYFLLCNQVDNIFQTMFINWNFTTVMKIISGRYILLMFIMFYVNGYQILSYFFTLFLPFFFLRFYFFKKNLFVIFFQKWWLCFVCWYHPYWQLVKNCRKEKSHVYCARRLVHLGSQRMTVKEKSIFRCLLQEIKSVCIQVQYESINWSCIKKFY